MRVLRMISLMVLGIFLVACASPKVSVEPQASPSHDLITSEPSLTPDPQDILPSQTPTSLPTVGVVPTLGSELPLIGEDAPIFTQDLITELGEELVIDSQEVSLVSFEEVEWRDSCLGVERKEVLCLEVITPGYLFIFETPEGNYEAHTNLDGTHYLFVPQVKLIPSPP